VVAAFKKRKGKRPLSKIDSSTLKGFGGGWNAIDDDLSMSPSYQVSLVNFHRTTSGAQAVRFGQRFNADIRNVRNSPIVDGYYYNGRNVVVTESGNVLILNETGSSIVEIWNNTIAGALPGAPTGWTGGVKHVSFVPFKDTLIIHNGKDKPITISALFAVNYLQDLATGSNANVPIANYGCVAANYHCLASTVTTSGGGTILNYNKTEVVISSKGSAGTFPLDPAPNDAVSIDVGAYAPEGAAAIRGIAGFRTYLLVFLQNITLQIKLGQYDDSGKHVPVFPDTLPQFGVLGNRCIVTVENDIMFCGVSGLASAKRNLYAPDSITSDFLSTQISPAYRQIVGALSDDDHLTKTFAAFDKLNNDFLLFMPEGKVLCYTFNPRLKMHAWSQYEDMTWNAAWTSVLGRLFMVSGTKIFQGGNNTFEDERYYADRLLDQEDVYTGASRTAPFVAGNRTFDPINQESWKCLVSHPAAFYPTFAQELLNNPEKWEQYFGEEIKMELELPWIDGKDPVKLKQLRYISIATKGDAEFTVEVYTDNLYKDVEDNIVRSPGVTMTFIGNDAYGYGFADDAIGTGYGMGRRSRDPRLYALPIKFKSIKFKIVGSVAKKLEIVNLSFLYARNKQHGYIR
jgi:hypothetical protein